MNRRLLTHLLLSLVLLLSQQMAVAHVLSHSFGQLSPSVQAGGEVLDDGGDGGDNLAKASVHAKNCQQCLVFVQFASAIGTTPVSFAPQDSSTQRADTQTQVPHWTRAPCAFHPRAPPQA